MEFHRSLFKAGLQQKWNGHHSTRPSFAARDSLGKSTKPKPWRLKRGGGFEFGTFGRLLCDLDVRIPCFVSRLLHPALLRLYKAGRPIGRNCSREAGASEGAAVVPDSDAGLRVGTYRHSQTHTTHHLANCSSTVFCFQTLFSLPVFTVVCARHMYLFPAYVNQPKPKPDSGSASALLVYAPIVCRHLQETCI